MYSVHFRIICICLDYEELFFLNFDTKHYKKHRSDECITMDLCFFFRDRVMIHLTLIHGLILYDATAVYLL